MKESVLDREWLIARLSSNRSKIGLFPLTYIKSNIIHNPIEGSEYYDDADGLKENQAIWILSEKLNSKF